MDGSEAQSEGEKGSAGGEEESQSRQEPEDQVAQGAGGEEAAARQGVEAALLAQAGFLSHDSIIEAR
jgi:hypothetical protein